MKLPTLSRKKREPLALSPAQMADRLPASVWESFGRWPFADLPFVENAEAVTAQQLRTIANATVRLSGTVHTRHESGQFLLRVDHGEFDSTQVWVDPLIDPARYSQLAGLEMDVVVDLDSTGQDTSLREGVLTEVRGIQAPLQPGDEAGLARGIVQEVDRSPYNSESYGMLLRMAAGEIACITWNPSRSLGLHEAQCLDPGSAVAMEVRENYGTYMSDVFAGSFYLLDSPLR